MKLRKALLFLSVFVISLSSLGRWYSSDVFAAAQQIRITEIMYDPLGNGDKEFIEIYNGSDTTANLAGWIFSNGVDYSFPSGTTLEPGKYGVVVRNSSVFRSAYPNARVFGQYVGKLLGSGELIKLVDSSGAGVSQVDYRSGGAWPSNARNGGPSLSLTKVSGDETSPGCWGYSTSNGGSPGSTNSATGGGGCSNKSYLTTPPPPAQPQDNPSNNSQEENKEPAAQDNPAGAEATTDTSDQSIKDLSPEQLAVLEEQGKQEEAEDNAGDVTKLGSTDPFVKKILGLLLGCFVIFLGVGYVVSDKLVKHKNKHPIYSKLNQKLAKLRRNLVKRIRN